MLVSLHDMFVKLQTAEVKKYGLGNVKRCSSFFRSSAAVFLRFVNICIFERNNAESTASSLEHCGFLRGTAIEDCFAKQKTQ